MPKYYSIQKSGRKATVNIYGDLTPWVWEPSDVSAWSVKQDLDEIDADEIHVHINSYGGAVSEGFAVYNALRNHPARVITHADGFVASAAIYPFLAGEQRIANPVSAFYFHQVMISASGNADELRKAAENADTLNEQGLQAFEAAGVPAAVAKELELRDCFVGPEEMVRLGIATELGRKADSEGAKQSIIPEVIQKLLGRIPEQNTATRGAGSPDTGQKDAVDKEPGDGAVQVAALGRAFQEGFQEERRGRLRELFRT